MTTIGRTDNTRVLLLCGGDGNRWGDYTGRPKHLVEIDARPLLDHTLDRLWSIAPDLEILIVSNDPEYDRQGTVRVAVDQTIAHRKSEKFMSSRAHWNKHGPSLLLFGDVWLTDFSGTQMLGGEMESICFFGRMSKSDFTGCPYREIFALRFMPSHHAAIEQIIEEHISDTADVSANPAGWQLYNALNFEGEAQPGLKPVFFNLDDFTEDFDYPEDFDAWIENRSNWPESYPAKSLHRPEAVTHRPPLKPDTVQKPKRRLTKRLLYLLSGISIGIVVGFLLHG